MADFILILIYIFPIVLIFFLVIFIGLTDRLRNEKNSENETAKSKKRLKILISVFAGYIVSFVALCYLYRKEHGIIFETYLLMPYMIVLFFVLVIINVISLITAKIRSILNIASDLKLRH